ncbi:MAG: hypothetical protein FJ303_00965 [Planctomycetes bacterium]|nr:hypothetical protein [Planctomycetota bacterium]
MLDKRRWARSNNNEDHADHCPLARFSRTLMVRSTLTTPDPNDGAIREGEAPYFSDNGTDTDPTSNVANPPPAHTMMLLLVWSLRVLAVLLAGWAAYWTFFAMMFRLEGFDELEWIKKVDLELGGAFALAVVFFFVPERLKKPMQCFLIIAIAALVGFASADT